MRDCDLFGISSDSLRASLHEKTGELKRQAGALKKQLGDYRQEHGKLLLFFEEISARLPKIAPLPFIYDSKKASRRVASPITAVLCHNDTHMGAEQPAFEVEGINSFSPSILENRVNRLTAKFLDWVELHRSNYALNEVVLLCMGDLISGDIHEELRVTNSFPVPVQVVRAGELLARMVSTIAPLFRSVRVEFVVEDNHGRLTKKPQAKEAGMNSFNYVVGYIAKSMLKDHKNVLFNMYPQYEAVVTVSSRKYLITHGHGVMGWMGFPYYGVERKLAREALSRMNGPDMNKFHKVIMGHWHAPLSHPWYWISGSMSGTDAFDHKAGRHALPSQAAWMVHPVHGEFDRTDFTL